MAQKVTLKEIMTAVRELTFDRFIIPAFAIKAMAGKTVSVDKDLFCIKDGASGNVDLELNLTTIPTLEDLMNVLIEEGIIVAYTPYFRSTEPASSLIKVTDKSLDEDFTAFRRYFFSDQEVMDMISWYYSRVLAINNVDVSDTTMARLVRPSERHLAIWCAYHLTDKRRLYENAAVTIGQSFTDGSDYVGNNNTGVGVTTTVQIGSVFSITEDPSQGHLYEDFNRVGSDNTWGDRHSFWYKLMLYLRGLLEEQFGDYSLRKTNVIPGTINLHKDINFRSYYDSYPFTLSPLTRGVISKQQ